MPKPSNLDAVIIEPAARHRASVIWLHGLGADGHDFEPIVPELGLPEDHGIRFVFPHAPVRPVTINNGMAMRAWYDVRTPDLRREEDAEGITASGEIIRQLIAAEVRAGISANKIVLAGFSQGGAMTLHCGLRHPQPLAGLLALSCYLPLPARLAAEAQTASRSVPILMMHGVLDPVIPISAGQQSYELLRRSGYDIEWHTYPMQHSVCLEEVEHIGRWLREILVAD